MVHLTIRLRPYQDEAISSYMIRLAEANGLSLFSLWRLVREKGKHDIQRADISIIDFAPINVITAKKLAQLSVIDVELLLKGSMYYVIGKFFKGEKLEKARFLSGTIRNHLVYCPICLKEHKYYRLLWRINGVDLCLKHKVQLLANCGTCNQTIEYKNISNIDECPNCYGKLSSTNISKKVSKAEYLSQKKLQESWYKLLEPSLLKLTPAEVAIRILYLANQQNPILDRDKVKNNFNNKVELSRMFQLARESLVGKRAIHISILLQFLRIFKIDVISFFDIKVPESFVESIKQPIGNMKNKYSCLAPWCRNFGEKGKLTKTGTSLKRKRSGKEFHYYLVCQECGCEYAVNESGQLEERTYFIKAYFLFEEFLNSQSNLKLLSEKSGLSKDKVRRCYAYFRTRGLVKSTDAINSSWIGKQIDIDECLLSKVIKAVEICTPIKDIEKWQIWNSYDHFLTYRFHSEVIKAILNQRRRGTKRESKVNLKIVYNLLEEFSGKEIEISLTNIAKLLNVSHETLRRIGANPIIVEAKKTQRESKLRKRACELQKLADVFLKTNHFQKVKASDMYRFLGVSRNVLWRTNPEITNFLGVKLRDHNRSLDQVE